MSRFTVREVLDSTGAVLARGAAELVVEGVCTDTRRLRRGKLFLALSGPNFDGNAFAGAALEAGAGALLLRANGEQRPAVDALGGAAPVLLHPDPRRALGDLAAWHRSRLGAVVVGVTGSCGKTTTKNILAQLLEGRRSTVVSPSSFNNDVGVPHTLLLADESTEVLVVELGTNAPGEIAGLARIARPQGGVITNVGAAHLEGLGSLEGVAQEKGALAAALPRDGFLVLNADCRFTPQMRAGTSARVITFSVEGEGDLDAREPVFHAGGTSFRLGGHAVTSPLLGTHNLQNLLAALAVCRALDIDLVDLLPTVSRLEGGRQRTERIELDGLTLFDDSYNSNPESARAAVHLLAGQHGHARRVLVLGDMLELGPFAPELHHGVGMEAARQGIDRLILVGELAAAAAAGALEGGLAPEQVTHFANADDAAAAVPELLAEGDVVLVKGSRATHLEGVAAAIHRAWEGRARSANGSGAPV